MGNLTVNAEVTITNATLAKIFATVLALIAFYFMIKSAAN